MDKTSRILRGWVCCPIDRWVSPEISSEPTFVLMVDFTEFGNFLSHRPHRIRAAFWCCTC